MEGRRLKGARGEADRLYDVICRTGPPQRAGSSFADDEKSAERGLAL